MLYDKFLVFIEISVMNLHLYADKKLITNKDDTFKCKRILIRPGKLNSTKNGLFPQSFNINDTREIIDKISRPIKVMFMDFLVGNFDLSLLNQIITSPKIKGVIFYNNAYIFITVLIPYIIKSINIKTLTFKYQYDNSLTLINNIIDYISEFEKETDLHLKLGFKFKNIKIMNTDLLSSIVKLTNLYKLYIDRGPIEEIYTSFITSLIEHPNLTKVALHNSINIGPNFIFELMLKPGLKTFRFCPLQYLSKNDIEHYCKTLSVSKIEKILVTHVLLDQSDKGTLLMESISKYLLKIKIKQLFQSMTLPTDSVEKVTENCDLSKENIILIRDKLQANIINKYRNESSLTKLCSDYVCKHYDKEIITEYKEVLLV